MSMIKNVVFDFGQVLVHFKPVYMVGKFVADEGDSAMIVQALFDRLYWDQLDAGTITDEQVLLAVKERLPERLWSVAETIYWEWIHNIPAIEGMEEVIKTVKEKHQKQVFLLSNISKYFAAHADEIPILRYIEKRVFSAVCGMVKPHENIFAHLCDKYAILPQETLFIDDSEKNIAGAEAFGIQGYLFDGDVEKLRRYLEDVL